MTWLGFVRKIGFSLLMTGFVVACGGLGPSDDAADPLVAFDVPRQGDTVSGSVTITVQAFDDDAVVAVRIFADGTQLGEDPSVPYQATWNAGGTVNPTTHTLRAEARDLSGNIGTAQITVVVKERTPQ